MHLLTVEDYDQHGKPRGLLCDLDGVPMPKGNTPREIYLDNLTGDHFAKIMPSEFSAMSAAGLQVYQGVGEVSGHFVPAPDHTLNGRFGRESTPEETEAAAAPAETIQIHQTRQKPTFVKKAAKKAKR